eukprot:PhM_4_TR2249/c1_g1_i1/m.22132
MPCCVWVMVLRSMNSLRGTPTEPDSAMPSWRQCVSVTLVMRTSPGVVCLFVAVSMQSSFVPPTKVSTMDALPPRRYRPSLSSSTNSVPATVGMCEKVLLVIDTSHSTHSRPCTKRCTTTEWRRSFADAPTPIAGPRPSWKTVLPIVPLLCALNVRSGNSLRWEPVLFGRFTASDPPPEPDKNAWEMSTVACSSTTIPRQNSFSFVDITTTGRLPSPAMPRCCLTVIRTPTSMSTVQPAASVRDSTTRSSLMRTLQFAFEEYAEDVRISNEDKSFSAVCLISVCVPLRHTTAYELPNSVPMCRAKGGHVLWAPQSKRSRTGPRRAKPTGRLLCITSICIALPSASSVGGGSV